MEFTNNQSNVKRVLLPLEPDFSNMSNPSVILEPPNNDWRSDNRQAQTPLSGHMSRRDQSKSKYRSKKRRRHRSTSTSSSSRSASSDSRKKRRSKRSKHSHTKRRRRYTSSSSSSSSDSQSHDYGRYKRTRHSPQAVQNANILQPAEITNVQTILPEQTLQHPSKDSGSDSENETWSFYRAINEVFRLLLRSYAQGYARSILR